VAAALEFAGRLDPAEVGAAAEARVLCRRRTLQNQLTSNESPREQNTWGFETSRRVRIGEGSPYSKASESAQPGEIRPTGSGESVADELKRNCLWQAETSIRATHGFAAAQCALGGIVPGRRSRSLSLAPRRLFDHG
jgi:hypothetical protein